MRSDIVRFVRKACNRYGYEAIYQPENDTYCLMYRGRAIQNFNTVQFFQYPQAQRMRELGIFLHHSLSHNLGEAHKNQFFLPRRNGIRIA